MSHLGLRKHPSPRLAACRRCGGSIKFGERYVHSGPHNFHLACFCDAKGRPIFSCKRTRRGGC